MAAVMEEQDVPRLRPVDHPAERGHDVGAGRHHRRAGLVRQDLNEALLEPEPPHERLAHGPHVVDAAVELVLGALVVAAHEHGRFLLALLHIRSKLIR